MSVALAALEEPSPARRTAIDVDDFQAAADAFALRQANVAGIVRTLHNELAANSPCIGSDRSARFLTASYAPAAETALRGLTALHDVLGPIAEGLAKAGTDHSRADAISAQDWRTTDYTTVTPNYAIVGAASPPAGGAPDITGAEPGWLPGLLKNVWPCKDDGKLGSLAGAWRTARAEVADARTALHNALDALTGNNQGDDLDELDGFWQELVGDNVSIFPALDTAFGAIADALDAYRAMIDNFRAALDEAVADAAATAAGESAIAILVDIASDGFGALFGSAEGAAIATQAAATVGRVCDDVVNALRVSAAVTDIGVTAAAPVDLSAAIQYLPQPDVATRETWQAADDIAPQGNFNPDELSIAAYLQSTNHVVTSIHEDHGKITGRNTDALVDGRPVEFKTIEPGTMPSRVGNALKSIQSKGGQAADVVIDARGTARGPSSDHLFSRTTVEQELSNFFTGQKRRTNGTVERVTVLLPDGSTATWPPTYEGL